MEETDLKLETVFYRQAMKADAAVTYRLSSTEIIRVCRTCVLLGDAEALGAGDVTGTQPYRGLPLLNLYSFSDMVPAVMLDAASIWLPESSFSADLTYIPAAYPPFGDAAIWVTRRNADGEYDFLEALPIPDMSMFMAMKPALFNMSKELFSVLKAEDVKLLKPRLQVLRVTQNLCLHLQGAFASLMVTLAPQEVEDKASIVINANGRKYGLDGYMDCFLITADVSSVSCNQHKQSHQEAIPDAKKVNCWDT